MHTTVKNFRQLVVYFQNRLQLLRQLIPRLIAPGIVPCIISFSRQLPSFMDAELLSW